MKNLYIYIDRYQCICVYTHIKTMKQTIQKNTKNTYKKRIKT